MRPLDILHAFEKLPAGRRRYAFQFFTGIITPVNSRDQEELDRCDWVMDKLEQAINAPLPKEPGWWNQP